jgi:ABC-type transport system substrate-binding protein
MKFLKVLLPLVVSLSLLASVAGCGTTEPTDTTKTSPTTSTPANDKYGGTLTVTFPANPSSLYTIVLTGNARWLVYPAVEQLGRAQLDGSYQPWLCESWERDNDALTFTLHLHKGITFSDGSDFTADVVKWNLQMMMDNGMATALCNPTDFEVVNANTLRVHFKDLSLDWENSYGSCYIYSKLCYDTNGLDYAKIHPVGTGPFVLEEYLPDTHLHYVRNDNYWQEGLPYLDGYNIDIMPDMTTQQTVFLNGETASFFTSIPEVVELIESRGYKSVTAESAAYYDFFGIYVACGDGVKDDPFYNTDVRKAVLLYGIDWDAVANACTGGYGKAHLQECDEGAYHYDPTLEKESYYDLDKAKSMLKDAGYGDGFETELFPGHPVFNTAATAIQDQLKNLGITSTVTVTTAAVSLRNEGVTPGIFFFAAPGSFDPTNNILNLYNRNGQLSKFISYSDNYQAAVGRLQAATTLDEKKSALKDINRYNYVEDCYGRCTYEMPHFIYLNSKVHDSGLETNVYYSPEITYLTK